MRTMSATLMAGIVSGYLSHIPHNLSTLKLHHPQHSYWHHMKFLSETYMSKGYVQALPKSSRQGMAVALAVVFPKGLIVRTAQIIGTFVILNGTIHSLKDRLG